MIKVGITGQSGFIGSHLASAIDEADDLELVPFEDAFFADETKLRAFVRECDAVLHLAAMSRCPSEDELYATNMGLVRKLIGAMEKERVTPHVLFSSSTHEARETAYGRAKREGRAAFEDWARAHDAAFTGFIFPNVYGPGARVFHCSFIANFAWQLNHGEEPTLQVDAPIRLIYVKHLVELIVARLRHVASGGCPPADRVVRMEIPWDFEKKVSEVLAIFRSFAAGEIDASGDANYRNLLATFRSYR